LGNPNKRKNPENATDKTIIEIKTKKLDSSKLLFRGFFYVHSRTKNNSGESHPNQLNRRARSHYKSTRQ